MHYKQAQPTSGKQLLTPAQLPRFGISLNAYMLLAQWLSFLFFF
jgi:hypothetical protein